VTVTPTLGFVAGALLAGLAAGWWARRRVRAVSAAAERAAASLTARLRRAELLAVHAHDIILLVDGQLRLVDFNDRFCELLGYSRQEALALGVRDLRDPTTLADQPLRTFEEVEAGANLVETRLRRKDGSTFAVEASLRITETEGNRYILAVIRDISERRRLELQLHLADRMASVATLSSGVAHEINNPLAYVAGNIDFVLSRLDHLPASLGEVRHALEDARGGASRVGQIVHDLRTFSRAGEAERTKVDVRKALQVAVSLAQTEIRQRAQLSLELGPVPPVSGSAHRIGQVLLNLLVNAAQAIPPGEPDNNLVKASTSLAPDGRVRIEIADSGTGIPADVLPLVFDPFFTTRAPGQGTGLGLAIVHGIVTDMGGEILVRSEPQGGSTFTVLLPQARRGVLPSGEPLFTPVPMPRTPLPDPEASPSAATGRTEPGPTAPAPLRTVAPLAPVQPAEPPTETVTLVLSDIADILVVDDEPMVGRAITRMLAPPHHVVAVTSAAEALTLLATKRFDAILCDLRMPEMTGMTFHERLLAEAPDLAARIVFLTGGAFSSEASEFLASVPNPQLEKPFTLAQLRTAVATVLVASRG